jgi:hypothetical protein
MVSFDVGGESYEVIPDEDSAATNRARAIAALGKIAAAQSNIDDDIALIDVGLGILIGPPAPTNAQVVAVVIGLAEIIQRNLSRLSKIGEYLTAIIKYLIKIRDE